MRPSEFEKITLWLDEVRKWSGCMELGIWKQLLCSPLCTASRRKKKTPSFISLPQLMLSATPTCLEENKNKAAVSQSFNCDILKGLIYKAVSQRTLSEVGKIKNIYSSTGQRHWWETWNNCILHNTRPLPFNRLEETNCLCNLMTEMSLTYARVFECVFLSTYNGFCAKCNSSC